MREMLKLHCSLEETEESMEKEQFLTKKLLIPSNGSIRPRPIRACREGDKRSEAFYLYKAGHWNHCHRLVIQHLASGLNKPKAQTCLSKNITSAAKQHLCFSHKQNCNWFSPLSLSLLYWTPEPCIKQL